MPDLERETERLYRILQEMGDAMGKPFRSTLEQFKTVFESTGKNLNQTLGILDGTLKNTRSLMERAASAASEMGNRIDESNTGFSVLARQLQRGTVTSKEANDELFRTTSRIKNLESELEALEIEAELAGDSATRNALIEDRRQAKLDIASLKTREVWLQSSIAFVKLKESITPSIDGFKKITVGMMAFAKTHDAMAADPLGATTALLSKAIKTTASAVGGLLGVIPFVGAGLSKIAEAAGEAAATLNDFLGAELKKTAESMSKLAANGISFAGGLSELRTVANESGLNLTTFTKIVDRSKDSIKAMGISGGEGAKMIGMATKGMASTMGVSGNSLRDEMMAMGYSYEEQGVVAADYMKQMKSSGKLQTMTTEEIAKGTRDYGRDLKVIADITGQDAKKLMEKARVEAARGAVSAKLDANQKESFKAAQATLMQLGDAGPEMQGALSQMIAGGTVTSKAIAGNEHAMDLIRKLATGVTEANTDMISVTSEANGEFVEKMKASGDSTASLAKIFNASGTAEAVGKFQDTIGALQIDPETGKISKKAAEDMAVTQDGATKGFTAASSAAMNFSVEMEKIATDMLPSYGKVLETSLTTLTAVLDKAMSALGGGETVSKPKASSVGNFDKAVQAQDKSLEGASFWQKIGFGQNDEQKAATAARGKADQERAAYLSSGEAAQQKPNQDNARIDTASNANPKYADGGIASGPKTGFPVDLHGVEAVVPLPDGKSIPMQLPAEFARMIEQVSGLQQFNAITNQLASMTKSNDDVSSKSQTLAEDLKKSGGGIVEKLSSLFSAPADKPVQSPAKFDNTSIKEITDVTNETNRILAATMEKFDRLLTVMTDSATTQKNILQATY